MKEDNHVVLLDQSFAHWGKDYPRTRRQAWFKSPTSGTYGWGVFCYDGWPEPEDYAPDICKERCRSFFQDAKGRREL